MSSRATTQQAIEMLKFHQLRRENTAIYEQCQHLRNEVACLQKDHDKFHSQSTKAKNELQEAVKTSEAHAQTLTHLEGSLNEVIRHRDETNNSINTLKTQQKWQDGAHSSLQAAIVTFETKFKELERDIGAVASNNELGIIRLQEEMDNMARITDTAGLAARLDKVERDMVDKNNDGQNFGQKSWEESVGDDVHYDNREPTTVQPCSSSSPARNAQKIVSQADTESRPDATVRLRQLSQSESNLHRRASTVPDDIDLDQPSAETILNQYQPYPKNLVELGSLEPIPEIVCNISVADILLLQQKPDEDVGSYLRRGEAIYCEVPEPLKVRLIRWIGSGLYTSADRDRFDKQLEGTEYSWDVVKQAADSWNDTIKSREKVEQSERTTDNDQSRPRVDTIPEPEPSCGTITKNKTLTQLRTNPRRSQRLIEKSVRGQTTGLSVPPENHINPDSNVKPTADNLTLEQTELDGTHTAELNLQFARLRGHNAQVEGPDTTADLMSNTDTDTVTPTVLVERTPEMETLKPLSDHEARPRSHKIHPRPQHARNLRASARELNSATNEIPLPPPRLVPSKRKAPSKVPQEDAKRHNSSQPWIVPPKVGDKANVHRSHRRGRLPLPPPPEIPILSSSD